jgi:tetratricopeptide (TPR) repeat protein
MEPSICVGRKVQKHILKSLLSAALGKNSAKDSNSIAPRLFLFYGENGTGKSSMIDLCMLSVEEIAAETGKPAASILVDLDAWRFRNGMVPKTPRAMLDALYAATVGAREKFADSLAPYLELSAKVNETEAARQYYTGVEWPGEVFSSGKNDASSFQSWLETKIAPDDLALCNDPLENLTASFAECLVNISLEFPLVLCLDGLELAATPDVDGWLKNTLLPLLVKNKGSIAVICSGAHDYIRSFRNDFPEELRYTFSPAAHPLSRNDIAELALRRGVTLAPEEIEQIELSTGGVPLAAQAIIDFVKQDVSLNSLITGTPAETTDRARVVQETVDRFLLAGDETSKTRAFALAMLYRFDENILAQLWGIQNEEVAAAIADIAGRYPSIMRGDRLLGTIRDLLKNYLVTDEATRSGKSLVSEFFKKFTTVNASFYGQYLAQMQAQTPDAAARYADPNYQTTLVGLLNSLVLSSPQEVGKLLPGCFVEALQYAPDFAAAMLDFGDEFRPLLPPELSGLLEKLSTGLAVAAAAKSPLGSGAPVDGKDLDFMNKYEAAMTDTQKGLLHRLKGLLACHAEKYAKAAEEFKTSLVLFAPSSPERTILFENFLCVGYAFVKSGDKQKAIEAFAGAATIRPDDYAAWLEMALAQQSLGDHKAAISSYSEAVRIDHDAVEAWLELGNEYAAVSEHGHATESFIRVTELDPERPAAWFNLGISLEALMRFPEAQKAFERVVAAVPDHWEAFFGLGRSFSAQALSQEAIDALNKTVALKDDCIPAWKALGNELLIVQSYENAAAALERASVAEPDASDPELWHTIGKAWLGAGNFSNAVAACRKAVALRKEFFEAWVSLGQGQTELNNVKDAHAAFAKAAELNPKDKDIWVSVGNSLYAQANYPSSIEAYLKATALRPDTDGIWHNIGLAYHIQQKYAEAVDAFQKSIEGNPESAEAWYQMGRSYAELGQYDDAATCFARTVELTPDAHDAWYRQGLSFAKAKKHAEAIPAFIKAAELNASDAAIWYELGLSYSAAGNGAEAVQAFTQSITLAGDRPEAYYQLGLAQESLGVYEEAIAAYQKSTELAPEKYEPWVHLGFCCNYLSRYAEAVEALRKVLEFDPNNKEVFLPMALAAHAVGNYAEAADLYRKVIDYKPDSEEAQYNLALSLHAQNEYQEALAVYQTVVQKWPGKDQAWYNMGLAYHAVNDFKQAVAAYREASRLNPESPDIWYQLGMVFYATEQYGEAILAFRKVTSRRPDMYEAWYNLGNSYLIWHEYGDAITAYTKASEIRPDDYTSWGYLGSAYFAAGNYDKAAEASGKAFDMKSDEPWITGTFALAKLMSGDAAGAMPVFDALLATDTSGQEIGKAAAELQKTLSKNPSLKGGQEALQKLTVR